MPPTKLTTPTSSFALDLKVMRAAPKALASASKDLSGFPFLASLAEREEMVRNGKLTTIIFIRDKNHKGQEVSGYIDYAHRLKTENFEPYFERCEPRLA